MVEAEKCINCGKELEDIRIFNAYYNVRTCSQECNDEYVKKQEEKES